VALKRNFKFRIIQSGQKHPKRSRMNTCAKMVGGGVQAHRRVRFNR